MGAVAEQSHFPCDQCGAVLRYAIGTTALSCEHCGFENAIESSEQPILEHDLNDALKAIESSPADVVEHAASVRCQSCGAGFSLEANTHAGECVFCSEPVVIDTSTVRRFQPESLLPLAQEESQARAAHQRWLRGLWFAPSGLRRMAQTDQSFTAVFLPYWTYDSDTASNYRGERGDTYVTRRTVWVKRNGRRVRETQRVTKVRWRARSGRVQRHFDDVLVGASNTLPRQITDRLAPWDLDKLVPYSPQWLSGSESAVYQVPIDEGFDLAKDAMSRTITADIKRDIGGDFQRVHAVQTRHSNTTFKHVLLPVWVASFRYGGKPYRFLVNGRSGKTVGERPWSAFKIAFAVIAFLVLVIGGLWFLDHAGYLDLMLKQLARHV